MIFYGYHLKQKIYLKEHTSCILLHFSKNEDMMEYIQDLSMINRVSDFRERRKNWNAILGVFLWSIFQDSYHQERARQGYLRSVLPYDPYILP